MLINITDAIDILNKTGNSPDYIKYKGKMLCYLKHVSTDGWRGYESVVPAHGFKILEDADWVSGDWDDAPLGHSSNEVESKLEQLAKNQDIFVVYTPTSNVFSTVFTVLVKDLNASKKRGKKLANNTWLIEYDNGDKAIRLHDTDILYEAGGVIRLNNGGFDTMTTRERMNKYLPDHHGVFRERGKTYFRAYTIRNTIPYENGISFLGHITIR